MALALTLTLALTLIMTLTMVMTLNLPLSLNLVLVLTLTLVLQEYSGDFAHGLPHGVGQLTHPDGWSYDGAFDRGRLSGQGMFTWPDGSHYDGEFLPLAGDQMGGRALHRTMTSQPTAEITQIKYSTVTHYSIFQTIINTALQYTVV